MPVKNNWVDGETFRAADLNALATEANAGAARETVRTEVFSCQGGNYVVSRQLTSNVATLTTLIPHGYQVGDEVWINGIDATFNSSYGGPTTISSVPSATTFSYARTGSNVAATPVAPYANVFKAQYWTMPAGAVAVRFTLCGPGGGGGSGARQATTSNRSGGGGGGGAGWAEFTWPASEIPTGQLTVQVPNGGYGGLPATANSSVGMAGRSGGGSYSTSVRANDNGDNGSFTLNAAPGNGGAAGGTATAAGGGGGGNTQFAGGAGGAGNTTTGSGAPGAVAACPGGGGGGGAAANVTTAAAGGTSTIIFAARTLNQAGVRPGDGTTTMDASFVANYYSVKAGLPGMGGGGGAYKTATNGGNGGNAVNYGAGGGGGGAADNGFQSGAGGIGGDGSVVITTYF